MHTKVFIICKFNILSYVLRNITAQCVGNLKLVNCLFALQNRKWRPRHNKKISQHFQFTEFKFLTENEICFLKQKRKWRCSCIILLRKSANAFQWIEGLCPCVRRQCDDRSRIVMCGLAKRSLLPYSILAIWPVYLNLLDLITLAILDEGYKLWSSSCGSSSTLHSHLSRAQYSHQDLVFNTFSLYCSLNVRDHVSQPYRPTLVQLAILLFYIF